MKNYPSKKNTIAAFILVSLLAHLFVMYVLVLSGPLTFSTPVQTLSAILVTFKSTVARPSIKAGKADSGHYDTTPPAGSSPQRKKATGRKFS